jgi:hypothetical protein
MRVDGLTESVVIGGMSGVLGGIFRWYGQTGYAIL